MIYRTFMKSKIHRASITETNLEYEGSVTIDINLMKMSDILPYERVEIYNVTNGQRFATYAIEGEENSGVICINGAAAHLCNKGDLVIIASYVQITQEEIPWHKPKVILVNQQNQLTSDQSL